MEIPLPYENKMGKEFARKCLNTWMADSFHSLMCASISGQWLPGKALLSMTLKFLVPRIVWGVGRSADQLGMSMIDLEREGKHWLSEGFAGLGHDRASVNVS